MIVKVLMGDGSSKTLMVDERQTVRELLDKLFEKTHCDRSIEWSLCETNPELDTGEIRVTGAYRQRREAAAHMLQSCSFRKFWLTFALILSERGFEDHECLVEPLSAWTRHSENKVYFVSRPQKYVMFTEPQVRSRMSALLTNI